MTHLRMMHVDDMFTFNNVNFDSYTETYRVSFYHNYIARWPGMCQIAQAVNGSIQGYMIGKSEDLSGGADLPHSLRGHVSAVTVDPRYRRNGVASQLMDNFEAVSEKQYKGYFIDLFVRASNKTAIEFYKRRGYIVYREVANYYGDEDAYDMRKATALDREKETLTPKATRIAPNEYD
ncbi:Acetyltransferase (GNAT) family [Carpediemonas membranifera]|uniref:Acetyltransferase (GNAT) family n=1 Tax=Carpediemonas membranifera TaxID=201153 RepID=A0A8J6AR93_9EUKA|nr:Acetyltransferase (GNAT) family [Carpediemonas membranifera]|eukprot:KAG9390155.1 Acetyltransferase (GNAT) family [Carpediemonas membranifera]